MAENQVLYVEISNGTWINVGTTIDYGDNQYGLIKSMEVDSVMVEVLKICGKKRTDVSRTSKLYGLKYLVYHPFALPIKVLVKDINCIIFVANEFLWERSFLAHHRGFFNVYGIAQQVIRIIKRRRKSWKVIEIDGVHFMEGGPCRIFPLVEQSASFLVHMYEAFMTTFYRFLSTIKIEFPFSYMILFYNYIGFCA
jgi:hypothetical protein